MNTLLSSLDCFQRLAVVMETQQKVAMEVATLSCSSASFALASSFLPLCCYAKSVRFII